MSDQNSVTSGAALRAASTQIVEGESGARYRVRRLTPAELVTIYSAVPDVAGLASAPEVVEVSPKRRAELLARQEDILRLGLLDPRIADDGIAVWDIPGVDVEPIITAIMSLSDMSREAAQRLRPLLAVQP